jgi:hypothetical protein
MVSVVTSTSSIEEVAAWILSITTQGTSTLFQRQQINGEALFELAEPDLSEMGVLVGPRKVILKHLAGRRSSAAAESTTGTQQQTDAVQAKLTEWLETHPNKKSQTQGSVTSPKRRKTSVRRTLSVAPSLAISVECEICKKPCEDVVKCWMCKTSMHPGCVVRVGPNSSCNQCDTDSE